MGQKPFCIEELLRFPEICFTESILKLLMKSLEYASEEKGSSFCKCSIFLGFIMSKKQETLRSELLSEDKITNLLVFVT